MVTGDADSMAEMPEAHPEDRTRNVRTYGSSASNTTAPKETSRLTASQLMEAVVERENMERAYRRVVRNGGAPGVDEMPVGALLDHLRAHWPRIKEALLAGRYAPSPVRIVEIPKPTGGVRMLGIPTCVDRLIQQALLQVLTPIFDPTFSESSYGFRPGRSTHQAVLAARAHMASGKRWVVDLDLEKFFDRVNHDVLMARVARRVEDKRALLLIRRYLQAGAMTGGIVTARTEGTPQGGPISPLLSNVLLDDLDQELERRGHSFCRYADDCNVYVQSKAAGERVLASLTRFLEGKLRLKVNAQKSAVARPWDRKFLGYSVTMHKAPRLKVAAESVLRLKTALKETFRRGRGRSLRNLIADLTPKLRGWIAYFKLSDVKGIFEELDSWIRRRLRCVLWRQWKRSYTRAKNLMKRGLTEDRAWISATNGRGPWWNAGASHMNDAFRTGYFKQLGLVSLQQELRRLQSLT
jgi:RNA-directed DNA polymerase